MSLPAAAVTSLTAGQTDDAYLWLLDVYVGGSVVYRFTNDAVATTYNLETYSPFPFDIYMPAYRENQPATMQLRIDNVSRELIDDIRLEAEAIRIDVKLVLASTLELMTEYTHFSWRQLTYDALSIAGTLTLEGLLNEPYPEGKLTGTRYPGLH